MNLDVVCFGALNIDMLYKVNKFAKPGYESIILRANEYPGGSAANTAVGLARLGINTGFIGKIAKDREGLIHIKSFKKENVNLDSIVLSRVGKSGKVIGFVDSTGERSLYIDPGVNNSLSFEEIKHRYLSGVKILHLTSFFADTPFDAQKKLSMSLSNYNLTFDPGTVYAELGLNKLEPILANCYVIFPNEEELRLLTGKEYKSGSKILLKKGVKIIAVKLGDKGCYITNGIEKYLIPPKNVRVVDTTGAGDAFCAGFIYGLIKNYNLNKCGILGNFVASKCIQNFGARDGLPYKKDLPL